MAKRLVCEYCGEIEVLATTKDYLQVLVDFEQKHSKCRVPYYIYRVTVKGGEEHNVSTN